MSRYVTELVGTFFLVFTIGMTAGVAAAPLAIGATLMVMVYMGGHVSGAHYNPAVTLAVFMRGGVAKGDVVPYVLAQLLGAALAAMTVLALTGATFALALVVLNVATAPATKGNSYYGLAIGFTVLAGAFAVGPHSGGAFNPAVGIGPALVDTIAGGGALGNAWLYVVGPLAGAAAAVPVFRLQNGRA